jgi:hypothetical protein
LYGYAGGSVATGTASHAIQVKDDDPDKKEHSAPPCWGLGLGLTTPPLKKRPIEKILKRKGPLRAVIRWQEEEEEEEEEEEDDDDDDDDDDDAN